MIGSSVPFTAEYRTTVGQYSNVLPRGLGIEGFDSERFGPCGHDGRSDPGNSLSTDIRTLQGSPSEFLTPDPIHGLTISGLNGRH